MVSEAVSALSSLVKATLTGDSSNAFTGHGIFGRQERMPARRTTSNFGAIAFRAVGLAAFARFETIALPFETAGLVLGQLFPRLQQVELGPAQFGIEGRPLGMGRQDGKGQQE